MYGLLVTALYDEHMEKTNLQQIRKKGLFLNVALKS